MKVIIAEFMDQAAVALLQEQFETHYDPTLVDRRSELASSLGDADALIVRNRTQVDLALLDGAPCLQVVGRLGVGLDNIDVDACALRGIAVIPATGANAGAVAEYVVGAALALLRGVVTRSAETATGNWPRTALSGGHEIAGKTLGLVGFGSIGQLTARLACRLGMNIIAHDPLLAADAPVWGEGWAVSGTMADLLAQADILSLHVPLTDQTRNLIDSVALARMKPGALLINTARGGIVDEDAVADALRSGYLGGAAIDVFAQEPLAAGSALASAPNVILTPHIAGVSMESNVRVSSLIAERVATHLRRNRV
jgi:(S)-sulfolactate dehydrogenase